MTSNNMVTVDQYGKAEPSEVTEFQNAADLCEQLVSGLRNFSGVLPKATYISRIDTAVSIIDQLIVLRTNLLADKATLEAA